MPKALVARNWLIRNLRRIQFAMQEEQLYAKCGQDERTSTYQSYCVSALLFSKKISTKQDITSTEISYQFLARRFPLLRRNKATNSSTLTDPFSAATKTLVLGIIYSSLKDLPSHSHGPFAIGDNEKNKTIVIFSSSLSPSGKLPVRM